MIKLRGNENLLRKNVSDVMTIAIANPHNKTFRTFLDLDTFSPLVYSAIRKINKDVIAIKTAMKSKLLKLLVS